VNNILISFTADTSGLDQVQAELKKLQAEEQNILDRIKQLDTATGQYSAKQKKAYDELQSNLAGTRKSIADLHAQQKNAGATVAAGAATNKLTSELRKLRNEISQLEMAGDNSSQRFIDLSVRAAELQDQIGDTQQQIRALASDTRNLDAAISVGQGLTGAFTAATAGAALLGGESEELQRAFFKVQAALQVLNGVQMVANTLNKDSVASVVLKNAISKLFTKTTVGEAGAITAATAATAANTAATGAATVATKGWTAALLANPVFWIVAVIMGVIAAISKLAGSMKSQLEIQNEINEKEKIHLEYIQQKQSAYKSYSDDYVAKMQRELTLMKEQGASREQIRAQEDRIFAERQSHAGRQAEWNKNEVKNLDENATRLERLRVQLKALNNLKAEGKSGTYQINVEGQMLKGNVDDLIETVQGRFDSTQIQVNAGLDTLKLTDELDKDIQASNARRLRDSQKDAATLAGIRVAEAKKGDDEELKARLDYIEKQRNVSLSAENLSAADRKRINYDADVEILKARDDVVKNRLKDEMNYLEAAVALQIQTAGEGTQKEFELRQEMLQKQFEYDSANYELQAGERLKIQYKYWQDDQKLQDDFNMKSTENTLNAQIASINAQLSAAEKGSEEELLLRKKMLEKQAELERAKIIDTINNEELKNAKILELDEKLKAQLLQNQKEYDQKVIDNILASTQTEIEAERIKNEKIAASGNFIERMRATTELKKLQIDAIDAEMNALDAAREKGIVSEQEYLQQKADLQNEYGKLELATLQEIEDAKSQIRQASFDFAVGLVNNMFDSQKERLQRQLEDLHEYYTTDEEEAEKNGNKRLASEEYIAAKELEIKQKIARAEKQQATFQATVDGIAGVVKALSSAPPPYNLILAAITAAAVAAQIAKIQSQQLPKYAKGKKGKRTEGGEWSWVGERGPEIMFIPHMASIIPAHKSKNVTPGVMRDFNISMPEYPAMPKIDFPATDRGRSPQFRIDYNKLGKAVADNVKIPEVSQLNVNWDEGGFSKYLVTRNSKTKIMNTFSKYN
jgi:predicted  nucleic acid-binding Zn-ribbon protein